MNVKEKELFNDLKKPLVKHATVAINVKRIFTDVDGVIVDKATVPASLQVDYPVYLWGEMDRLGSYYLANRLLPPNANTKFLTAFVWGSGANPYFFGFSGLANIQSQIQLGDLVTVYTDNITAPNYFIWIVLNASGKSMAAVQQNTVTTQKDGVYGMLEVKKIQYFTDNNLQWLENFRVVKSDNLGVPMVNNVSPYIFRNPYIENDRFIEIYWKYPINQFNGILFNYLFSTDEITLNFIFNRF